MTTDLYLLALAESSRLKLRATALLTEGGSDSAYRASVLFHEAVRAEARAVSALPAPSAETRLRSAVERCGCLIDGRDPSAVIEVAWPEVLETSDEINAALSRSLRARIDPKMAAFLKEYSEERRAAHDLFDRLGSPGIFSSRRARQIDRLVRRFPGDPRLWTMKALNAVASGNDERAITCAHRAQALLLESTPEDRIEASAPALEALLCARSRPLEEAEAAVDAIYARLRAGPASAARYFALVAAGLILAQRSGGGSRRLWERIAELASTSASQAGVDGRLHDFLRAAQRIAFAVLSGRVPSLDILHRAGLGEIASLAQSKDPIEVLGAAMSGRVFGMAA